jgi:hypothetical protein
MGAPLRLTTGDIWDDDAVCPTGGRDPAPADVEPSLRRRYDYIGGFVERIPPLRAIRAKCASCMGGDADRMPRGDVAQAIDECSSSGCPLWPFRYAADPWRPEATAKQRAAGRGSIAKARARLGTSQTTSPEKAADAAAGTAGRPAPVVLAGAAVSRAS